MRFQCSSASRKFLNSRFSRDFCGVDRCFSALQRAENSSTGARCWRERRRGSFSALQRAENSSIVGAEVRARTDAVFQCSSASRKFLNFEPDETVRSRVAVFQCSSASRKFLNCDTADKQKPRRRVSVLFSEPKIPQFVL